MKGTDLFGWCLDRLHDKCKKEFTYDGKPIACGCRCHKEA